MICNNKNEFVNDILLADLRETKIEQRFENVCFFKTQRQRFFCKFKEVLFVVPNEQIDLYLKLYAGKCIKLTDVIDFYHGIQTRGNKNALSDKQCLGLKPIIKGADFNRYKLPKVKTYMNFTKEHIKSGGDLSYYDLPSKLVIRTTADRIVASIDYDQNLVLNSVNVGKLRNTDWSLEYILGIINSKLIEFWYRLSVQETAKTFAEVKIVYMERIPICDIDRDKQSALSSLVSKVLEEDVGDDSFRILIERIDILVYHLYGLTYDEVLIVDPDTSITREEYEAYRGE